MFQQARLFIQLLIWFVVRHLKNYPWRVLTVLLGIGLGSAVFTSVRLSVNASLDSFTKSMDLIAGKADWVVTVPGGRVSDSLMTKLVQLPFIESASPIILIYVRPAIESAAPFLLIGLDPILDRPLRAWRIEQAGADTTTRRLDLLSRPGTMLISEQLARKYRLKAGDDLPIEYVLRKGNFHILGLLSEQGLATAEGGLLALTDISTMQEFTGLEGLADRIDILLAPSAPKDAREQIEAILPKGATLERPTENKQSGTQMIVAYQINLSILSFVSLFVGMFLVYSLVALNARSRRHELAILRSIGASSQRLFVLFLTEGALLGLFGWLLALPLSTLLVRRLLGAVSNTISNLFVRVEVDRLHLSSWEVLLSFVVTMAVAVLASYQPAREAMAVAPREVLAAQAVSLATRRNLRKLAWTGLLLIAAVWPLSEIPGPPGLPLPGYIATFLLFTGFSLISPWCLHVVGTYLPPILRRLQGEPAYLAGRYVRDAGMRTAISVGALITAMALFVALVIMVHSFRETVRTWADQSISGDLFLRTNLAEINQYRFGLPEEVVSYLEGMREKSHIDLLPYRRVYLRYAEIPYQMDNIDFDVLMEYGNLLFVKGSAPEAMPDLRSGRGILVSEVFSNKTGLTVGDRFHAQIEGALFSVPIVGVFRDYRTQGGAVLYDIASFERMTGDRTWSGVRVFFRNRNQDTDAAATRLRDDILLRFAERYGIGAILGKDLRREIMRIFDETFAITTVLLLIALIVAALGITTTLTVLVLERKRQLNTLLAIGAGIGQIRRMIVWEAILMVSIGEAVGLGCGFILSYILVFVINRQSFGWTFVYSVDWPALLPALPLILLTALLASLPAIRIVFRYSPAMALRE